MGLRERNRRAIMRETQKKALALFENRGFEIVTIADIATEIEISESTIYRHFKTKEGIILWDEHDKELDRSLGKRLRKHQPLEAIRDAFIEDIGKRYDEDGGHQLRRVRFIYATEAIHAAAIEADFKAREELSAGLKHFLSKKNQKSAPLLAAISLTTLDIAIEQWQRIDGQSLARNIAEMFSNLQRLDTLT